MHEGQSQRSVASRAQHRQEADVAAAEERERVTAKTAATETRAARLAMEELAATKTEVEAAAAAELEALRSNSTSSSVSADGGTDDELKLARKAARDQATQWATAHPQGHGDGWINGDHDLYRRRDSPSPDRYHDHRRIQTIVTDVGPSDGWPTLTKTNYVEWATVMRIRLQVWHMWEAVRYGDIDYYEDRRALDALIAAIPTEM
jgi:hypothetical protein